ncbi:hypothetical protein GCM10011391_22930 [Pullulanibacillus camelliae]|uniref:TIGR02206 family membrane protein n=1 Tax=Pullulanibacillus camelliae TaxID=1707096 RepID=A0A8J3DUK2_9BACL|nr:TIGR02206 family membrane protein [Pullulanibacillus camelliae]GGE43582.1 hypothetical protein GCM10011391_22930 [Pullulanibacillus camelliae]
MKAFFDYHPHYESFQLFAWQHIVTMLILLILGILIFVFKDQLRVPRRRIPICSVLACLLFIAYGALQLWLIAERAWDWKKDLPLQLSDSVVILAIVMLAMASERLFQFMYFAGLGSSLQAIITPDLGRFGFPHFRYFEFFVAHGGVVLACLFMVACYRYRPTLRSLWITFMIINGYGGLVFCLNKWLGANYLYMMKKPRSASLLSVLGPWPWYLLSLELVMLISFFILYCPFWLRQKTR